MDIFRFSAILGIAAAMLLTATSASAATCFGQSAETLHSKSNVRIERGEAVILKNRTRIRVNAPGGNKICAHRGPIDLRLGAQGSSLVRLGRGDDQVRLSGELENQFDRTIWTGLGDDRVAVTGRGHTTAYLSPKRVGPGSRDTDHYSGNRDIDTVYDYGGGTNESPNVIKGNRALDYLQSAGTARSDVYGGDGTDYLYVASRGDGRDRMFGDRGNDRLNARGGGEGANGVYMDGAEGDDWFYGSSGPDTMLSLSGIKKMYGGAGDDTFIRTAIGKSTIYGQAGRDTLSYKGHIPPGWNKEWSGMYVTLGSFRKGPGNAAGGDEGEDPIISSIEHLIGSAFDDHMYGRPGRITIEGGPGDDQLTQYKGNVVDGGLGSNSCNSAVPTCGHENAHFPAPDEIVIELSADGVPVILGSELDDEITLSLDAKDSAFRVETPGKVMLSGLCVATEALQTYSCPADPDLLSIGLISMGSGDDEIELDSLPEHMNVIVDGGAGVDRVHGDQSREVAFNLEHGHLAEGNDQIWMTDDSKLDAGPGSDTVHMTAMCVGGFVKGGPGVRDGIVFAGLKKGVWASMASHEARYLKGPCAKPFRFADDWEGLEGTRENDVLIGSRRRGITFLGRDGIDVFRARNGVYDKITVGGGGRRNQVVADPTDLIHWDWGYAAF